MIFPIGDDNIQGGHKPNLSYFLIVINVAIFIYQITTKSLKELDLFYLEFGVIPMEISGGIDLFTLMTSMFLHGDLFHLAGNMLFLWIFADNIEAVLGTALFGLYYIVGGLFASLVHIYICLLYTSPSPRDQRGSRMPSSA